MIDYLTGLNSMLYLNGLILAMAYTVTQDQRGQKAQFLVLTIPAQTLPVCMIVATALMVGPNAALVEIEGLFAAHLYDFLTRLWPEFGNGPQLLRIPSWLERLVRTPRVLNRGFGTAIRPGNSASTGSSSGVDKGGPLPDSWRTRGRGQRLG
jgi:Derlin-2/3